jgi:UDP-N-acetylmuramoylalanine--D-glutamate ligase
MSEDWLPRRALVVGLARSGRAAVAALEQRGVEVVAVDRDLGNDGPAAAEDVDLLVKSPGVPGEAPVVAAARRRGVPVWSEVELGYRLLGGAPLYGVTGTNGKTTTAELLGAILRAAGRRVEVAGNVGTALTEVAERIEPGASVVCELSSFQLEDVHTLACDVAILLNIEPDHLDRHGTFEHYRDAKLRIFERARTKVAPRGFGIEDAIEFAGDDPLPAEPRIPGAHNRENAAAATAAARAAGVADEAIAEALRTFAGVPHRLELVRELHGVRYVNDSKATNTAAARRGLAAYDEPVHVILGGSLKGEDFGPFARGLPANIRTIHLIGEASGELADALDSAGWAYDRDGDLATAVSHASSLAQDGDIVLLSPACASYDQFDNFEQRGDAFRRFVERLS